MQSKALIKPASNAWITAIKHQKGEANQTEASGLPIFRTAQMRSFLQNFERQEREKSAIKTRKIIEFDFQWSFNLKF